MEGDKIYIESGPLVGMENILKKLTEKRWELHLSWSLWEILLGSK